MTYVAQSARGGKNSRAPPLLTEGESVLVCSARQSRSALSSASR